MPPKAKPGAKGKAAAKPEPSPPLQHPEEFKLTIPEALTGLSQVCEEAWSELAECDEFAEPIAGVLNALLLLLGNPEASSPEVARAAMHEKDSIARLVNVLGPWGIGDSQLEKVEEKIKSVNVTAFQKTSAAGSGSSAAAVLKGPKAKPKAKAAAAPSLPPGAEAASALGALVQAFVAFRKGDEHPPGFPMSWPTDPLSALHTRLRSAFLSKQSATIVCPNAATTAAAMLYFVRMGALTFDVADLQLQVGLSKTLSRGQASGKLKSKFLEAMKQGRQLVLLLGAAPQELMPLCGPAPNCFPAEGFEHEKVTEVAASFGLECGTNFHLVVIVEMPKAMAEHVLPKVVPGFEEMATMVLDEKSLPNIESLTRGSAKSDLYAALQLLALPPMEGGAASATPAVFAPDQPLVNTAEFEYVETFGEDYGSRWARGPATKDESGKEIRQSLINITLVKYPANPKDTKPCLQLVGGAQNAPCTGMWTSFAPLARPSEVEFEFTMNGKVDLPNACVVFTEKPFEHALPDCKIGVQFSVRGGMQLSGGGGNLVRISNDGKIQNDKWNKVLLKIDWNDKVVVGQVDTKGKGYAPAIQTVPFRDSSCEGFGNLYIYNTDTQATCWFSSLRIKQSQGDAFDGLNTDGLESRAVLAKRLQEREYQRAVDCDMEVGMKMGAIKCTKNHGMNLAEEQRANNSSFI